MKDKLLDEIIKKNKDKYIPKPSEQIFHSGLILLGSLIIGFLIGWASELPKGIKPEDVFIWRLGIGFGLGAVLGLIGALVYLVWNLYRAAKFAKATKSDLSA